VPCVSILGKCQIWRGTHFRHLSNSQLYKIIFLYIRATRHFRQLSKISIFGNCLTRRGGQPPGTGTPGRPPLSPYIYSSCELRYGSWEWQLGSCVYGSCEASCIAGSYDPPQPTSLSKLAAASWEVSSCTMLFTKNSQKIYKKYLDFFEKI
jgi:hypothetical protein